MNLFGSRNKTRPSKAEVIKTVLDHCKGCQCEADTHTLSDKVNGYIVTISITLDKSKQKA